MTPNNSAGSHLSDDDLDEILLGIAVAETTSHLKDCYVCADRFDTFQTELKSQMAAFNEASMAWSEARSNTISRDLTHHKATARLTLPKVWSAAAATVLVAALGLHVKLNHRPAALEASSATASETISGSSNAIHPEHDQYELASDNAMLAAIDSEMGTPRPTQFGIYQTVTASVALEQPATPEQMRD